MDKLTELKELHKNLKNGILNNDIILSYNLLYDNLTIEQVHELEYKQNVLRQAKRKIQAHINNLI